MVRPLSASIYTGFNSLARPARSLTIAATFMVVSLAATLDWTVGSAYSSDDYLGTLTGVVLDADSAAVKFATVMVLGTSRGTTTDEDGKFRITRIPPGTYSVKVLSVGNDPVTCAFTIHPWEVMNLTLGGVELRRWGMSDTAAAQESIGVDVSVTESDLQCRIFPTRRAFKVGEHPEFTVRIQNQSGHALQLVRSIDGSTDLDRYPHVSIEVEGPRGGFFVPVAARCANENDLAESDFVEISAGMDFDPFGGGWLPHEMGSGRFVKPGKYVATFRYSTNEPDVRRWLGWPPPRTLSGSISQRFRRVPLVDLACSVEFEVQE